MWAIILSLVFFVNEEKTGRAIEMPNNKSYVGRGIGVGAALGMIFGLLLGRNMAFSVVIGTAIGLLIGAIWDNLQRRG